MIKWFCDVYEREIQEPESPVSLRAYRCGKSREDEEIGWGTPNYLGKVMCHQNCADVLEGELRSAFINARRIVKNNQP